MTSSFFPPATESDGARYELGRVLGTGSAGTVYLAVDRDTGEQVALKKLIRFDTKSVMRLKREFRSLANMHHPNLVKLYDLGRSRDAWFLTMEYLEGVDLLAHLGVSTDALATNHAGFGMPPIDRVLSTFHQLARGVSALHEAKLLHRDLKPTNVMVTAGRVVALDFGLACALDDEDRLVTHDGSISGTPAYMPPEQALGQTLSEVSDWYAVGVMLYQVLSGQLPIDGRNANELLRRKLDRDPTPLSRLNAQVPARLEDMCMRLLSREPEARPQGEEVLSVLAEYEPDPLQLDVHSMQTELGMRSESQALTGTRLFGRDEALNHLQGALDQAERGEPVVVHVSGASGTGKTALVECFLQRVTADTSGLGFVETLVLRSRCYEREAMPFKALDGVIDALVRYLSQLDDIDVAHVLPEYVAELAQLFPALDRLRAVQRLAANARPRNDSAQARTRAEQALRELFMRLASRRTLVLWIDDLQWGDLDSASLLEGWLPLVRHASILFVFSYRSEELQTSSCLKLLLDSSKRHPELVPKQVIELTPLTDADMERLCQERLRDSSAASPDLVRRIVKEARGNPFLASQLTALAQARAEGAEPTGALSLEALVAENTALLSPPARELLNVLAIAGRPVSSPIALRTAGVSRDGNAHLHALKTMRLIRTREVGGERRIEVYHDRVRESVHSALSDEERVRIYDRLLREVEVSGHMDVDWMHSLALGAGQKVPALRYGSIAAERASTALAFERAADLYQVCLTLTEPEAVSGELWHKYALALARCRRGKQAAQAYLEASQRAAPAEALPLIRLAAMHLLRSGDFERGEELVDRVLAAHGESVPHADSSLIASLAWERGRLALRAGRYNARVEAAVPNDLRERVELFATLTVDTMAYDPLRAALFQARTTRNALAAGDPISVARAHCLAATMACVNGTEKAAQRSAALLAEAEELCKGQASSTRLRRYICVARSVCAALLGHPEQALAPAEEAVRSYKADTRGDEHGEYYHSFTAVAVRISALAALGDYPEFIAELQDCMERARVTENHSSMLHLTVHQTLADQVLGQAEVSLPRLEQERALLPKKRFGVLHAMRMCAVMAAANGTGDFDRARALVDEWWPRYTKSVVHRSAYLAILAHAEHARMLLNQRVAKGELRDMSKLIAADLRALDGSALRLHAVSAAQILRARIAYFEGDAERAIALLREVLSAQHEAGLKAEAAVTRRALGRLLQDRAGAEGAQLSQAADAQLTKCGIRNPPEYCARYFPELDRAVSGARRTIAAEVRETG